MLSEILEHGYDSERGRAALRRMNRLHGRFAISNAAFLYVLSTFIYEPVRWNARFGWRPMVAQEKLAGFYYWREIGRRMNIKDIPGDYAAFERFNARIATSTRDMFLGWFLPKALHRFGAPFLYAVLDDALLDAFGFPPPTPAHRRLVTGLLRLRGRLVRLLPERRSPRLRTGPRRPTYPNGYAIEELGPKETPPVARAFLAREPVASPRPAGGINPPATAHERQELRGDPSQGAV
jgi:hypothetical protein